MADPPVRISVTGGTVVASPDQPPGQGQASYVQRLIEVTVTLSPDQKTGQPIKFAGTGSDTVTLSGFRTSVDIQNSGAPAGSAASVKVYGLGDTLMNQLSTLGIVFNSIQRNSITIAAGDATNGLSPVFAGTTNFSFPDYNKSPNVPMIFECQTGLINAVVPVAASSFAQATDVATIMAGFARAMNLSFENNGVTLQMPPSYFPGTLLSQVQRCARAANINAEIVDGSTKLAIWPMGGTRDSVKLRPMVSKDTGMIGYPTFQPNGYMIVSTLFNPQISFGGTIEVKSNVVTQANRTWVVQKLDLSLDSLVPKGNWKATCHCYPLGFPAPPPPGG